jgi:ABC-type amino acid transport substrate-binding protein
MKKSVFSFMAIITTVLILATIAAAGPVMDRILKNGELVVGISGAQLPFNATTKTGEIIGFDADLAKAIAGNLAVKVEFATMPFADLLPALEKGTVDMIISGMAMLPSRNRKAAFVGPYYVSGKGILTTAAKAAMFTDLQSMNKPDVKLAALKDSTSQMFVEKVVFLSERVTVNTYKEALDLLTKGEIDALIADYPYCAVTAFRYREKGLTSADFKLSFEPVGIALPEDTLLINYVQNILILLKGEGALEGLEERWFKKIDWLKDVKE